MEVWRRDDRAADRDGWDMGLKAWKYIASCFESRDIRNNGIRCQGPITSIAGRINGRYLKAGQWET